MLMLIDTREPPPDPVEQRPAWEPNWRLWGWVALMIAAAIVSASTAGVVAYALALVTLGSACRAVIAVMPPLDGLREYRQ
jgi:hypothetical protein